jgi:hypothetical protein
VNAARDALAAGAPLNEAAAGLDTVASTLEKRAKQPELSE